MPLPTLIKTWEFRTNLVSPAGSSGALSARQLSVSLKNALTDTIAHLYAGTADIQSLGGTSFRINPNPGGSNTALDPARVGSLATKTMKLRGMTTAENNGDFVITAHTDLGGGEWVVDYTNSDPSAIAEDVAGSVNVLGGNFTVPWVIDFTTKTADYGVPGDGVDKIVTPSDMTSNTTNSAAWVIHNTVTGTRWCMSGDVSSSSYSGTRMVLRQTMAPASFAAHVNDDIPPDGILDALGATLHTEYSSNGDVWFWDTTTAYNAKIQCMMSNDGEQTRLSAFAFGLNPLFWIDGVLDNPHPLWTGATPVVATMQRSAASIAASYGNFNDATSLRCSAIPEPLNVLSPNGEEVRYNLPVYLTGEGYIDGVNSQKWGGPNELSGEYPLYPMGVASFTPGLRARLGELPDIWWNPTDLYVGHSFPSDNSRQFMCFGDITLPWNGDFMEMG